MLIHYPDHFFSFFIYQLYQIWITLMMLHQAEPLKPNEQMFLSTPNKTHPKPKGNENREQKATLQQENEPRGGPNRKRDILISASLPHAATRTFQPFFLSSRTPTANHIPKQSDRA
jgi:hypothetical protein